MKPPIRSVVLIRIHEGSSRTIVLECGHLIFETIDRLAIVPDACPCDSCEVGIPMIDPQPLLAVWKVRDARRSIEPDEP